MAVHYHEYGDTAIRTYGQARRSERRLTTKFSDRTPALQHAGAQRSCEQMARPPAAEHFMCPGSLQRRVSRQIAEAQTLHGSATTIVTCLSSPSDMSLKSGRAVK